jgi:hypothetical protein
VIVVVIVFNLLYNLVSAFAKYAGGSKYEPFGTLIMKLKLKQESICSCSQRVSNF